MDLRRIERVVKTTKTHRNALKCLNLEDWLSAAVHRAAVILNVKALCRKEIMKFIQIFGCLGTVLTSMKAHHRAANASLPVAAVR